ALLEEALVHGDVEGGVRDHGQVAHLHDLGGVGHPSEQEQRAEQERDTRHPGPPISGWHLDAVYTLRRARVSAVLRVRVSRPSGLTPCPTRCSASSRAA